MSSEGDAHAGRCDSCGRLGETVTEVRRVYLRAAGWDRPEEEVDVQTEPEWWCDVCRDHYPHALPR